VSPLGDTPIGYQLLITATGGTFTLTGPSDTTGNLAAGISAGSLETAIEGLTGITDVSVSAVTVDGDSGFQIDLVTPATVSLSVDTTNLTDGSAVLTVSNTGDGFAIEFVNPATGITLTVGTGSLTGSASLILVQEGNLNPAGWTKSQEVSRGTPREFGLYQIFEISTEQAHTGSYSLKIDPGGVASRIDAFAGTQQIVNVEPGGLYQASVWVYPLASGQTYRLVLRGLDEDLIAYTNVSPPANTWTEVTISDVVIPDGDSQIIFRFANTQLSGNPSVFHVDDGALNPGQAAATLGAIVGDLYAQYTDTGLHSTIYWDDGTNPGTPYLTLDFSDTLDSGGNAWDQELSTRIYMRQTLLQVLENAGRTWNYEFRVVPDDVENQTYLLQIYNPGGMETDYTSSITPAIQGGQADTDRAIQRFLPPTEFMVEGTNRVVARARNAALQGALGKVGSARLDRQLPTEDAVGSAVAEDAADAVAAGLTYPYTITLPTSGPTGADVPLDAYVLGDALTIHDPPEVDDGGRLWDVTAVFSADKAEWNVKFLPLSVSS
jgi:hypothetical protein